MRRYVIVLVALLGTGGVAQAQDKPKLDAETRSEAKRRFRAGERFYNAGKYVEAATAFEMAYGLLPLPAIAFSTAQAYRLQYVADKNAAWLKRSIELYREYLRNAPDGGRRVDATTSLADLDPIMARIEAQTGTVKAEKMQVTTTQLMVSSQVDSARASLDGGELVAMPIVREVKPGKHTIKVVADGYFAVERKADVAKGQFRTIEVDLKEKPALIQVRTDGGATISVDGRPVGDAPFSKPVEVKAGKHFITVTKRGRHGWSREIDVKRGEQITLEADLDTTGQRKLSYWVAGGGLATMALGGVFGLAALGDDSDAKDVFDRIDAEGGTPDDLIAYSELIDSRDDNKTRMWVFVGVGGALLTTGVLLYFMDTPRAETPPSGPSISAVPIAGPDLAGLAVTGNF